MKTDCLRHLERSQAVALTKQKMFFQTFQNTLTIITVTRKITKTHPSNSKHKGWKQDVRGSEIRIMKTIDYRDIFLEKHGVFTVYIH